MAVVVRQPSESHRSANGRPSARHRSTNDQPSVSSLEAHEVVDASYSGDELVIAFNAEYLLKGLEIAPGDEVTLETTDNQKPAVLKASDHPEFLYLLMPVRIS